jgi:hypothetical protein
MLKALVKHCVAKGYMEEDDSSGILDQVEVSSSLDGRACQMLFATSHLTGYQLTRETRFHNGMTWQGKL